MNEKGMHEVCKVVKTAFVRTAGASQVRVLMRSLMTGDGVDYRTNKEMKVKISELKRGDLFRMSESESAPLWVRGEYDKGSRKYSTYKYDDVCHERFMKGGREVWQS